MIKFVLNPYPINKADYPAGMANQGLKPNEAKAVVEYLLGEVKWIREHVDLMAIAIVLISVSPILISWLTGRKKKG
jgi:hypothetical protein